MCGIAGLIFTPPGPVKSEWMQSLLQGLEHRGPDDLGWLSLLHGKIQRGRRVPENLVSQAMLIHRRLSILDLSDAGWQPMGTPDGRFWIVFNGEIYNYLELKEELRVLGYRFTSKSDTEVLLAAFAEWGPQAFKRLIGMFAMTILDAKAGKAFLVRDFFGIKPLYYTSWQDGFTFSSEIPPMLQLPGVDRSANPRRVYEYLRAGITDFGDETLFQNIKQVPPGHYIEVSLEEPGCAVATRYWDVELMRTSDLSFDEAASQIRKLFLSNVTLHQRSDVPIGAAVSGGVDSSSIVAVMRFLNPSLEIHAFSYVADDPRISEERWIDLMGHAIKATVHKVKPSPEDIVADLEQLIALQGEPFMSTSMYAQFRVFQQARKVGVKVMLDGQGADEMLGGYPTSRLARIRSLLRQGSCKEAWHFAQTASSLGTPWKLLARGIGGLAPSGIQEILRHALGRNIMPSWLNASWFRERGVEPSVAEYTDAPEMLRHELYQMLTETSLPQLLRYEDRNSMAFSIESRVPFLTPSIVNFLFALPEQYLISPGGETKSVLRKAMRGIVPDAILDRKDKMGFPTPEQRWLSGSRSWVEQVLTGQTARHIPVLNLHHMQQEWSRIVEGQRPYDSAVWRWLNLILWVEKFAVIM